MTTFANQIDYVCLGEAGGLEDEVDLLLSE